MHNLNGDEWVSEQDFESLWRRCDLLRSILMRMYVVQTVRLAEFNWLNAVDMQIAFISSSGVFFFSLSSQSSCGPHTYKICTHVRAYMYC